MMKITIRMMMYHLSHSDIVSSIHPSMSIGFNNRARNPKNYGNNKIFPDSWHDALLQSFAAMPVTRWSTVHQNLFFINAWVRRVIVLYRLIDGWEDGPVLPT